MRKVFGKPVVLGFYITFYVLTLALMWVEWFPGSMLLVILDLLGIVVIWVVYVNDTNNDTKRERLNGLTIATLVFTGLAFAHVMSSLQVLQESHIAWAYTPVAAVVVALVCRWLMLNRPKNHA